MNQNRLKIRKLTVTAMLAGVATVLMFVSFPIPFLMPPFIKLDFSELPALLAAFALGPIHGLMVCVVKCLVNLFFTTTAGVGEFSNLLLGALFVVPAGMVYSKFKSKKGAFWGALLGAIVMALASVATNYFIVYPAYSLVMPTEAILGMYQAIVPKIENLWQALVFFNMPFTFVKGMLSLCMAMLIYKPLAPILKGHK